MIQMHILEFWSHFLRPEWCCNSVAAVHSCLLWKMCITRGETVMNHWWPAGILNSARMDSDFSFKAETANIFISQMKNMFLKCDYQEGLCKMDPFDFFLQWCHQTTFFKSMYLFFFTMKPIGEDNGKSLHSNKQTFKQITYICASYILEKEKKSSLLKFKSVLGWTSCKHTVNSGKYLRFAADESDESCNVILLCLLT